MTDFVSYRACAGEHTALLDALMPRLHTRNMDANTAVAMWTQAADALCRAEATALGVEKLTEEKVADVQRAVMRADLNVSLSVRWGFKAHSIVMQSSRAGQFDLMVDPTMQSDEVLDSFWKLWAYLPHDFPKSAEVRPLVERGITLGQQYKYPVGTMTSREILDFVNGYLARTVYTLEDVGSMSHMVFMPLALGAFNLPEEAGDPLSDLAAGEEPKRPTYPTNPKLPEKPKRGEKPAEPKYLDPDYKTMQGFLDLSWEEPDLADTQRADYLAALKVQNMVLESAWATAVAEWEKDTPYKAALRAWKTKCKALKAKYEAALKNYEENAAKRYREEHAAWERKSDLADMAYAALQATRMSDVGTVWADTAQDKPMPRAINGMPMFSSCRIMSKADIAKASKLIDSELRRREEQRVELAEMMGEDPNIKPPEKPKTVGDLVREAVPKVTHNEDGTVTVEKRWTNPDGTAGLISAVMDSLEDLKGNGVGGVLHIT